MEEIKILVNFVNKLLWEKNILVILLIGTGLYFTYKTKFVQLRLFKEIVKSLFRNNNVEGRSSFESFCLGTACRVGAGNIAGVVAAISFGGPGALFWMWIVAIIGSSTAFIESTLAVANRKKINNNEYIGGTPWIIEKKLNKKKLGYLFSFSSVICYIGVAQVMSNTMTETIITNYKINKSIIAMIISIIVGILVLGKKDKIIDSLNKIVPIMAALYLLVVLYIIIKNITLLDDVFLSIINNAFGTKEFLSGTFGGVIMQGVRRGLFSNEAGSGNSGYAASIADVDHPVKQGLVQILSVFVDTLLICTATACIILFNDPLMTSGLNGMALFQESLKSQIGWLGTPFTMITIILFCFSTILGIIFYGKNALYFINKSNKLNLSYKILMVAMIYIGGIEENYFVWGLADFGLGIMTVINILSILPISGEALGLLKEYENDLAQEKIVENKIKL
ncbi:MAG: alanine/glycine:cation symporter family protein [Cetobacterium sp.]|uniref:alanine/glycine:cation symporter family protein n=1 Tax=Cetobacterium sp. TaxID=2071632 RepID=UPI003F2FC46C